MHLSLDFTTPTCYDCEKNFGDLDTTGSTCAYCRLPSNKRQCDYLLENDRYFLMTRLYDGSALSINIFASFFPNYTPKYLIFLMDFHSKSFLYVFNLKKLEKKKILKYS